MKYIYLLLFITLYSCEEKGNSLEAERAVVMKIHDDAMAKMGFINVAVDSLTKMRTESPDSMLIDNVISELEEAEEGMMIWMQEYKEPSVGLEDFYKAEKQRITQVAENIDQSLKNAKKYIEE